MALNPDGMAYFFGMLFGKEVTVKAAGQATPVSKDSHVAICTYRDARGKEVAGCIFDFQLACFTSAALSMVPAGAAESAIENTEIPESLMENLNEVFNVAVGFFGNGKVGPNLRLHEMSVFPPTEPKKLATLVDSINARKDYQVDIEDYGSGGMTLFLMAS